MPHTDPMLSRPDSTELRQERESLIINQLGIGYQGVFVVALLWRKYHENLLYVRLLGRSRATGRGGPGLKGKPLNVPDKSTWQPKGKGDLPAIREVCLDASALPYHMLAPRDLSKVNGEHVDARVDGIVELTPACHSIGECKLVRGH